MKARYQSFLFIALLFLGKEAFSQTNELESTLDFPDEQQNTEEKEISVKKTNDQLQYEDLPLLPIDEISEGQSATLHGPIKKLRFRSHSKDDLEAESETRTRQR